MTTRALTTVDIPDIPAGIGDLGRAGPSAEPSRGRQRRDAMLIGGR
jgi:hypothetical protein